jgi:uncharacterized protein DUF5676
MTKLNPWTFGAVISITVVVNYVLCTMFWFAFTGPSIKFLNVLFHGMDFNKIYVSSAFSIGDFLYVLIVFAVWAYVLGVIYAVTRNLLIGRDGA